MLSGCTGDFLSDVLPGLTNSVIVEVYNNTDLWVAPDVRYAESDSSWSEFVTGLFGGEALAVGELRPGELAEYRFDCDELGVIFSDETEQRDLLGTLATAARGTVLRHDRDFSCGDRITFEYVGTGRDFGVITSVNGRVR
jgi:hypothetical protein